MKPSQRMIRAGAAVLMLAGLALSDAAFGQQAAPVFDAGKLDPAKTESDKTDKPELKMPSIDLGKSQLQLDTTRAPIDTRVGIETKDPAVLNPGLPTQKTSPLTPDYFGLKLTTPIR